MAKDKKKENNQSNKVKKPAVVSTSLKEIERKRKQVFKPILDNAFTQSNLWPFISPELANEIMDHLTLLLSSIGKYNQLKQTTKVEPPEIINHVVLGFNSCVKRLEAQAQIHTKKNKVSLSSQTPYYKYIFVCKNDIVPPIITSTFPVLAYTGSKHKSNRVKLIQLPKGSIQRLSEILAVPNVGILGLTDDIIEGKHLFEMIDEHVKDIDIPWLESMFDGNSHFLPPAINFLSTSIPVFPKKNDQKQENKQKKLQQQEQQQQQ
ncbi:RNase P and RNase MRP subunit [Scheffersomyces amazonensis]|uniref:RNase P and RNase MRP subunit n=1 Tax=Scheffersomyces amazonensis TaxID=1078765 RepID=UPI00315D6E56